MNYFKNLNDGTSYEGKFSRTVWSGGSAMTSRDYLSLVISLRGLIKKVMINPITTMISAAVKATPAPEIIAECYCAVLGF